MRTRSSIRAWLAGARPLIGELGSSLVATDGSTAVDLALCAALVVFVTFVLPWAGPVVLGTRFLGASPSVVLGVLGIVLGYSCMNIATSGHPKDHLGCLLPSYRI